jgi:hypothetical protein
MFIVGPIQHRPGPPAELIVKVCYTKAGQTLLEQYEVEDCPEGESILLKLVDQLFERVRIPIGLERCPRCDCCGRPHVGGDDLETVLRGLSAME